MTGIYHYLLRHATASQQRANPVTDLPRRAGADFTDYARTLKAQKLTGSRRRRIHARALQQVGPIEASRGYANPNLPYITGGAWLFNPLHLTFNALQCFHSASIVSLD